MRVGVEWLGDEGNVRSDNGEVTRFDGDFSPAVTAAQSHLTFGHFQACVMGTRDETERCADDNDFGFWRRKDERVSARLLLQRASHVPMLKFNATPFLG